MKLEDWKIDKSAGRPILTYKDCSVIEAEDAEFVMRAVKAVLSTDEPAMAVAVDGADIGRCIRSLSVEHPLKWAEAEKTPILRGWFVGQVMKHFDGKPSEKQVRELIDLVFAMYPISKQVKP